MDLENISINPGSATLNKAVLWVAGTEGQGTFRNLQVVIKGTGETGILVDDTNQQWNALLFDNVWVQVGTHGTDGINAIGYDFECGLHQSGGSQSAQVIGGAIVDFAGTTPVFLKVNGTSGGPCKGISIVGPYVETSNQTAGDGIGFSVNNGEDVEISGVELNGGPKLASAVQVSGSGKVHASGYCYSNACGSGTNLINNTTTGYALATSGAFDYSYTSDSSNNTPPTYDGAGFQVTKTSAPSSAPGAGACQIYAVAGSGSTCNIDAICGTSTTPVVLGTSVGSGC